jgi:hypothetical protein
MYKAQKIYIWGNLTKVLSCAEDLDPDADRVGSASFCCVWIRIGINARQMKKLINFTFFHKISKFYSKYLK